MRIAIASGKGGTGKTTVAVNLALTAARAGLDVHLADCDVEEPNAHLFLTPDLDPAAQVRVSVPVVNQDVCSHCGACARICEFNAIACLPDRTMVFHDLCHSCDGCWLVCPTGAISQGERTLGEVASGWAGEMAFTHGVLRVGETLVPPLIAAVKARAKGAEWIILDAPPGATCPVVATMKDADFVVLVTEPTPFGLHDLALAAQLARRLGRPCGVVVNRALPGRDIIDRFCADEGLPLLAHIPFRREIAAACAEGALAVDVDPDVAGAVHDLLRALRRQEVAA
jgi:MinD superfamily P-loop ATPase